MLAALHLLSQLGFGLVRDLLKLEVLLFQFRNAFLVALAKGALSSAVDVALVSDLLLGKVRDSPRALLGRLHRGRCMLLPFTHSPRVGDRYMDGFRKSLKT